MKIKQTIIVLALSIGLGSILAPSIARAAECAGVETAIISCAEKGICQDGSDPYGSNSKDPTKENNGSCEDGSAPKTGTDTVNNSGIWGILSLVINIMTAGIGVLAVAGIVYGSILYTSAGGSAEQTKKAITIITNVVVGIIAYLLMYSLLNYIIPGGLFT